MISLSVPATAAVAIGQTVALLWVFFSLFQTQESLLHAAWFHIVMAVITLVAVTWFHAPYGRYALDSIVPITVDTRAAWLLQEMPTVVSAVYCLWLRGSSASSPAALALVGMFLMHYIHRSFVFPFMIRPKHRTPLHVMLLANAYCCFNGVLQSITLVYGSRLPGSATTATASIDWGQFCAGVALFYIGMLINLASDYALISLRKRREGYSVPRGFLFEWVSCPNFFGECVEWLGFAIAAMSIRPKEPLLWNLEGVVGLSFFLYTVSNTVPRGVKHHQWYLKTFSGYDKLRRKAVVPYVL